MRIPEIKETYMRKLAYLERKQYEDVCTHLDQGEDVRYLIRENGDIYTICPVCGKKEHATPIDLKTYKFKGELK